MTGSTLPCYSRAMNEHVRAPDAGTRSTRAAEGVARWRWTTAEIERMVRLGVFRDSDRFELIGGEIVPMASKGRRHEAVTDTLHELLTRRAPAGLWVSSERQFNLDDETFTDPDLVVRPSGVITYDLRAPAALLVIEVADTSLAYDLGAKASLYARFGVREYWVVDAWELETTVHRDPGAEGYASVSKHARDTVLTPQLAPALAIRLAELGLD